MKNKEYANGQKTYELIENKMTYFFNNGKIKAEGILENNQMQGEWKFYRKTGQLWQIGNFTNDIKDGTWIRYDENGRLEYSETFKDNKVIKKKE